MTGRAGGAVKLVWFVPLTHLEATREAVFTAGGGWVGEYARCSFATVGTGTFYGTEDTRPALGAPGRDERLAEARVEVRVPADKLVAAVDALRRAHPFEEPSIDAYPLLELPGAAA